MSKKEYTIKRYSDSQRNEWNKFVEESRNGTFLFKRDYMDYHADRFEDHSLVISNSKGRIVALMVAAIPRFSENSTVYAHPGLTYGGIVLPYSTTSLETGRIIDDILSYYHSVGFISLVYKPVPHIYHRFPTEDDIYFLFQKGGKVVETCLSSTLGKGKSPEIKENTRRNINKAFKNGVIYKCAHHDKEWYQFHRILSEVLNSRHATVPVHTFDEIMLLKSRFTENIKLWIASDSSGEILAGVVMYLTDRVSHCQYIASSPKGYATNALSGLIDFLINHYLEKYDFFDFGISTEDHGRYLNEGLIRQKNGFGGRGTVTNVLEIDLTPF